MAQLLKILHPDVTQYKDRRFEGNQAQWERALDTSATVYVGNTSFFTREEQVYDVFSRVGHIKRVVMGLDKRNKTPCGFCFVVYYSRGDAEVCIKVLNGTMLDDRAIRVDHDWGYVEGRQWGRGLSGGQVRDEFRQDFDAGRGGFGKILQQEVNSMNAQMEEGLQGYAALAQGQAQGQAEGGKHRRGSRGGSAGGRGDPSFQAPEQAPEDEEPAANRPRIQQQGSDNEQER